MFGDEGQFRVEMPVLCIGRCATRCAVARNPAFPSDFGAFLQTHNPLVGGSNPSGPTFPNSLRRNDKRRYLPTTSRVVATANTPLSVQSDAE